MPKVVTGCYICEHAIWGCDGCFCKLNNAKPLVPDIGCEQQKVKQTTDINSSYPESIVKPESNQLDSLEQRVDELSEEYDAVLKTHGDTLEMHKEQIEINEGNIESLCSDVEDLQRKVYQIYRFLTSVDPDFFAKVQDEMAHKCSNFCGNCTHATVKDGICACELSGEIVDPDSASCSMFEPPF